LIEILLGFEDTEWCVTKTAVVELDKTGLQTELAEQAVTERLLHFDIYRITSFWEIIHSGVAMKNNSNSNLMYNTPPQ
jgi:hypothetical protein